MVAHALWGGLVSFDIASQCYVHQVMCVLLASLLDDLTQIRSVCQTIQSDMTLHSCGGSKVVSVCYVMLAAKKSSLMLAKKTDTAANKSDTAAAQKNNSGWR